MELLLENWKKYTNLKEREGDFDKHEIISTIIEDVKAHMLGKDVEKYLSVAIDINKFQFDIVVNVKKTARFEWEESLNYFGDEDENTYLQNTKRFDIIFSFFKNPPVGGQHTDDDIIIYIDNYHKEMAEAIDNYMQYRVENNDIEFEDDPPRNKMSYEYDFRSAIMAFETEGAQDLQDMEATYLNNWLQYYDIYAIKYFAQNILDEYYQIFAHELQHMLDRFYLNRVETHEFKSPEYHNSPQELEAYTIGALSEFMRDLRNREPDHQIHQLIQNQNHRDLIHYILSNYFNRSFLSNLSQENARRIQKRVYTFTDQLFDQIHHYY